MIKKYALLIIYVIFLIWFSLLELPVKRLKRLNSQVNFDTNNLVSYKPRGYLFCYEVFGGFSNQIEQLWFLNLLAQKTNRGLVESPIKPFDIPGSAAVNISEFVNREKYFSNVPIIQEKEFKEICGPYIQTVKLPSRNLLREDEMKSMIKIINSIPDAVCISLDFFPSYFFFGSPEFIDWVPALKDSVLKNFEFSELIKNQADRFMQENNLEGGNFISFQVRRGDFKNHCKNLFDNESFNWSFGFLYDNKYAYSKDNWEEFELHCYPSISRLISIVTDFNSNLQEPVEKVLLLTNAKSDEISELTLGLKENSVKIIRFEPNRELIPKGIEWTVTHSLAVEMEIAIRGSYLIGNRHSTIFGNLIGLRLDKDFDNNKFI